MDETISDSDLDIYARHLVRMKVLHSDWPNSPIVSHLEGSSYLRESARYLWSDIRRDRPDTKIRTNQACIFMMVCVRIAERFRRDDDISSKFIDEIQRYDRFSSPREFMEEIFRWHRIYAECAANFDAEVSHSNRLMAALRFMANAAFSIAVHR